MTSKTFGASPKTPQAQGRLTPASKKVLRYSKLA